MDQPLSSDPFETHRRRLTELARRWLGNQAEAEDAVQDAYLRVRETLPSVPSDAEAWLVTVVRNLCADRLRRRRLEQRHASLDDVSPQHAPSAEQLVIRSRELAAALRLLLCHLPADEAAAVLLHAVFDFDHAEIGRLARRSEAASRQRVHRALHRVHERAHKKREAVERDDAELLMSLCWRALRTHDPAGLIALLISEAVSACALATTVTSSMHGAPRTRSTLVQSAGHFALSIELDGVVLCTLPLGPVESRVGNDVLARVD